MLIGILSIFAKKERAQIRLQGYITNSTFQFETQKIISELGLLGWMRVIANQRIEIDIEGPHPKLEALIQKLNVVASRLRLSRMEVVWRPFSGKMEDFRIQNN